MGKEFGDKQRQTKGYQRLGKYPRGSRCDSIGDKTMRERKQDNTGEETRQYGSDKV